jgi:hypothetical protein
MVVIFSGGRGGASESGTGFAGLGADSTGATTVAVGGAASLGTRPVQSIQIRANVSALE